jgi:hypothetical protein
MKTLGSIDGVLVQSWLQRFEYTIDYRHSRLVLNPDTPEGDRIPLSWRDGRPTIPVRTDNQARWMVLDSGAPIPVLFDAGASGGSLRLATSNGSSAASHVDIRLHVSGAKPRRLPAAVVNAETSRDGGLLPLRIFSSVYVNNRERYAIVRDR